MSARVIPFPGASAEPPVDPGQPIAAALRGWLAAETSGPWSDSCLIALLAGATERERGLIIAELADRWPSSPFPQPTRRLTP